MASWQDALRGTPLSNISAILSSPVREVNSSGKKEWAESPESSTVCCLKKIAKHAVVLTYFTMPVDIKNFLRISKSEFWKPESDLIGS